MAKTKRVPAVAETIDGSPAERPRYNFNVKQMEAKCSSCGNYYEGWCNCEQFPGKRPFRIIRTSIPRGAEEALAKKISDFHVYKNIKAQVLTPEQAEEWAADGRLRKSHYWWTHSPTEWPDQADSVLVADHELAEKANYSEYGGMLVGAYQRMMDMAEGFIDAWRIQQRTIDELTKKIEELSAPRKRKPRSETWVCGLGEEPGCGWSGSYQELVLVDDGESDGQQMWCEQCPKCGSFFVDLVRTPTGGDDAES